MWIQSQNKKITVDVTNLTTVKVFGDETMKACIMGKVISSGDEILLGFYSSMDEASIELDNIHKYFSRRLTNIYYMN